MITKLTPEEKESVKKRAGKRKVLKEVLKWSPYGMGVGVGPSILMHLNVPMVACYATGAGMGLLLGYYIHKKSNLDLTKEDIKKAFDKAEWDKRKQEWKNEGKSAKAFRGRQLAIKKSIEGRKTLAQLGK